MFYTYIITNRLKGKLYTGHTDDLVQRMEQHLHKVFPGWAAKHSCRYLLWYEEFDSRDAAFKRERRIKAWKRQWKINLLEQQNPDWLDIMACPTWPLPEGELFTELRTKAYREARIPIGKPPHFHPLDLTMLYPCLRPCLRRDERLLYQTNPLSVPQTLSQNLKYSP